ncbi:hypothetical protein BAE46_12460 [Glaciecola punicea]|uniref:hypothetical protein n=1 Tax=Glaciecola punicea TaxID=56804 RepID=UPI0008734710|nr:hypothetical protein [Glaciecola punicea]OFA30027.1 hypothetical protein BAE46_12460 [Glaciecola punicea]
MRVLILIIATIFITGCASMFEDTYRITYKTDMAGASIYCNGKNWGYAPVTLTYSPNKEARKSGYFYSRACEARWVSGARESFSTSWDLNKFPNGVEQTVRRPNVPNYQQDAEFALKVQTMQAQQKQAKAASNKSIYCFKGALGMVFCN